ncbi:MAG: ABC transporter permease [Acidobacteriaceae bacterium]|nr:ABC transporter permease [Acidobacteriaceae bacterium]
MNFLRYLAAKFLTKAEIEQELRSHIQHRADHLERSGLPRPEAERRAQVEFGSRVRFEEECKEALAGNFLETAIQDVRFAVRVLRKSPGFTLTAVLTLALAIGANAVVFSVLNALVLRPLNVPQAESFYAIQHGNEASSYESYPDYLDMRDRNRSFEGIAAYTVAAAALDAGANPSRVWVEEASGNYFDVLRLQPYLGRFFHAPDEHGENSAPYVVLTYAYWHRHFLDDRGVVGRAVQINKHPFTVLGVAPPAFRGTILFFNPDLFVPVVNREQVEGVGDLHTRSSRWVFMTMGHLEAGVTPAQATADLNSIASYLAKTYPKDDTQRTFKLVRPGLYGDYLGRPVRAFLTALMLLAGLILLAACANLGSLFAARAADRSKELAVRLALGSSRNRILRTLFTEAILIALVGGGVGLVASVQLLDWLSAWQPFSKWPIQMPVTPDAKVYGVALALALLSGLLFGIVPVRQVLRTDPYQVVKSGSTATVRRPVTVRDVLLVLQISICAVLVTSSLVAVRGLVRSLHSNFGFEPRNVLVVNTLLTMVGYQGDAMTTMQKRMLDTAQTVPGVVSVGLTDTTPLNGPAESAVYTDETADLRPSNAAARTSRFHISPGYFHAAGTALLSGRDVSWHDDANAPRVAVVNQQFARRIFGSLQDAMGRYYKLRDGTRTQVVGIVEDGKYDSLTEDPQPAMFLPILQSPSSDTWMVIKCSGDPAKLAGAMRKKLQALDPALPLYLSSWNQELDTALFAARMATVSLGVLGVLGAMLSITGIFGMAAYSVSRRLRDLGIRIALGARRREVLEAALGRAFRLLAFGSIAGLLLGIAASRVLSAIVYQATPRDPFVLAGVVIAMSLLGLLATWLPAQRVLSVDPLILLREE